MQSLFVAPASSGKGQCRDTGPSAPTASSGTAKVDKGKAKQVIFGVNSSTPPPHSPHHGSAVPGPSAFNGATASSPMHISSSSSSESSERSPSPAPTGGDVHETSSRENSPATGASSTAENRPANYPISNLLNGRLWTHKETKAAGLSAKAKRSQAGTVPKQSSSSATKGIKGKRRTGLKDGDKGFGGTLMLD
jgi:hypothetical protein